jgi:hypothetical protein
MKIYKYILLCSAIFSFALCSVLPYHIKANTPMELSEKTEKEEKNELKEDLKILAEIIVPQLHITNQFQKKQSVTLLTTRSSAPRHLHFSEVPTPPPNI